MATKAELAAQAANDKASVTIEIKDGLGAAFKVSLTNDSEGGQSDMVLVVKNQAQLQVYRNALDVAEGLLYLDDGMGQQPEVDPSILSGGGQLQPQMARFSGQRRQGGRTSRVEGYLPGGRQDQFGQGQDPRYQGGQPGYSGDARPDQPQQLAAGQFPNPAGTAQYPNWNAAQLAAWQAQHPGQTPQYGTQAISA